MALTELERLRLHRFLRISFRFWSIVAFLLALLMAAGAIDAVVEHTFPNPMLVAVMWGIGACVGFACSIWSWTRVKKYPDPPVQQQEEA